MLSKYTKRSPPDSELFITRKRKKYKFAKFDELENCYQLEEWLVAKPARDDARDSVIASEAKQSSQIILEVGAGTGLFSVELAQRYPEKFFIAVDIKSDRLYTGAKLATQLGLENIAFVRSEIARLGQIVPGGSVSQLWITFPDPYANEDQTGLKKSDAKHRLSAPRYLEIYKKLLKGSTLKQNGELHFKTDNRPLFEWSRAQLEATGFQISELSFDLHQSDLAADYKIKTSYEERFVAQGLPICYLTAKIKI
jgi:tRNA (guanine-N7-)-methyltransferase